MEFELPEEVMALALARNALRARYLECRLSFTLDGNLVGDLGEAVAAEIFGIQLHPPGHPGVDEISPDGRTVQVKASGTRRGPAFRFNELRADHLLFFHFDFEAHTGSVVFNGPEARALTLLPNVWAGQRLISLPRIVALDLQIPVNQRLHPIPL